MLTPMNTINYATETPPTQSTWQEFADNHDGGIAPLCYIDGVYDMLVKIEKIAQLSDFESMKIELANLYEDRRSLVVYALEHLP